MQTYSRDGLVFPVRDQGPPDGEVAVLLHGFPQDASAFDAVAARLHETGLRTLTPTQRGYAAGAQPRGRRAYALQETTADVLALLGAAGVERAHVVGHDWGAGPAWALGAAHPSRVASLTILSTPHPAAMARSLVRSTQALRSAYMAFFQLPGLPELVLRRRLAPLLRASGLPAEHVRRYTDVLRSDGVATGALNWYRGIPFSSRPLLGPSRVPTTYVWGRHDPALGRAAAERTGAFVEAAYAFVELDAGHWLPETRPGDVAAAVTARVREAGRA
ncbi:alpha/beta fold hydrolase [Motilibacter aurantiacus]|uniref:alpha/beta fold hydrolase n=1 Tax=Motilibacter aurantiacus TaxID=2714955 RepID=UPI00140ADB6D|nr:alpha/beta fold hydrolase [Motilibacter aurantiacus]NHC45357.1 alpha/beta fold hydrolase [Motilibacter aurantiacus]